MKIFIVVCHDTWYLMWHVLWRVDTTQQLKLLVIEIDSLKSHLTEVDSRAKIGGVVSAVARLVKWTLFCMNQTLQL